MTRTTLVAILWPLFLFAIAGTGHAVIGSFDDPFVGSPPFSNLICCEDALQCTDGDDTYQNCRMPTTAVGNRKLCGYAAGEEEYPYVCDACPGAPNGDCDGGGWIEVARGEFECDGPVYRGDVGGVRQVASDTWYVNVPGGPIECNDSYDFCLSASCFESSCIACSSIATWPGTTLCVEPEGQCHAGLLEGSTALLCCDAGGLCVRPNAATGDCTGSPSYEFGYNTLSSCTACPNPDDPANEELCQGWDLADEWWPAWEQELTRSINCSQHDEAGCNMALYDCDGVRVSIGDGMIQSNDCDTQPACTDAF